MRSVFFVLSLIFVSSVVFADLPEAFKKDVRTMQVTKDMATADRRARRVTNALLNPSKRVATLEERQEMVSAHLRAELFYAFNVSSGNTVHKHRIIHDFLSSLGNARDAQDREHKTILTVLSLAAQEYFWNPHSTTEDLKKRVQRELRNKLFRSSKTSLDMRGKLFLDEDTLSRVINTWVTEDLYQQLYDLFGEFQNRTLGQTYIGLIDTLLEGVPKSQSITMPEEAREVLPDRFPEGQIPVGFISSEGDGLCGYHSLCIPHAGAQFGAGRGNARDQMQANIQDQKDDPDAIMFGFTRSRYKNADGFEIFRELVPQEAWEIYEVSLAELAAHTQDRVTQKDQANAGVVDRLLEYREQLNQALQQFNTNIFDKATWEAWNAEQSKKAALIRLGNNIINIADVRNEQGYIHAFAEAFSEKERKLLWKNAKGNPNNHKLWALSRNCKLLTGGLLPGSGADNELTRDQVLYSLNTFISIFKDVSLLLENNELKDAIEQLEEERDAVISIIDSEQIEQDKTLDQTRRQMFRNLLTTGRISPEVKEAIAIDLAEVSENLDLVDNSGWMKLDDPRILLWAVMNNTNIFAYDDVARENYSLSLVGLNNSYNEQTFPLRKGDTDVLGANTVVLASPTGKNLYLRKAPGHWDKLVAEGDLATLAASLRHRAWRKLETEEKYKALSTRYPKRTS